MPIESPGTDKRETADGFGPNDIGESDLAEALRTSPDPTLLSELVNLSRELFGWFTKQTSRCYEYVWLAQKTKAFRNLAILDIGAGVSPLPVWLAHNHNSVFTIDNHNVQRVIGRNERAWNEWGYLDYGAIDDRIISMNTDISEADFDPEMFHCAYSISTIEHMPAKTRRILWDKLSSWLKPGGDLLLTFDLIPGRENLWNLYGGKEVETIEVHGDLRSVRLEAQHAGFNRVHMEVFDNRPGYHISNIALLHFKKS